MRLGDLLLLMGEAKIAVYILYGDGYDPELIYRGTADNYDCDRNYWVVSGGIYASDYEVIIEVEDY